MDNEQQPETKPENPLDQVLTVPVQYIFDLKTEVEALRFIHKTGRPITMPKNITAEEFNWFVDYLKDQRKKLINVKGDIPKKLTVVKDEVAEENKA